MRGFFGDGNDGNDAKEVLRSRFGRGRARFSLVGRAARTPLKRLTGSPPPARASPRRRRRAGRLAARRARLRGLPGVPGDAPGRRGVVRGRALAARGAGRGDAKPWACQPRRPTSRERRAKFPHAAHFVARCGLRPRHVERRYAPRRSLDVTVRLRAGTRNFGGQAGTTFEDTYLTRLGAWRRSCTSSGTPCTASSRARSRLSTSPARGARLIWWRSRRTSSSTSPGTRTRCLC